MSPIKGVMYICLWLLIEAIMPGIISLYVKIQKVDILEHWGWVVEYQSVLDKVMAHSPVRREIFIEIYIFNQRKCIWK